MRRPTVEDAEIAFVRVAGFLFELADDIEEWCRDTFQRKVAGGILLASVVLIGGCAAACRMRWR